MQKTLAFLFATLFVLLSGIASADKYTDISQAPAGEYQMDKKHGYITFSYSHQGYSKPWLRFRDIDATLTLDPKAPNNSKVVVTIDPDSIDSGVDVFDEHLRGKKFFDVMNHADIRFASTEVKVSGSDITLIGNLTMKGITKPLTLQGKFNQGGLHFRSKKPIIGFSATGTLKRSDWDLGAIKLVGDEVSLIIEAEFLHN